MRPLQLNKDMILNHITAEDIYKKFLNLSEFPKGNISSPFSTDSNPSFKLYKNGTFKCNSSGKQGDVFQFVADLNQIDCKTQFNDVLQSIAIEMNLTLQEDLNKLAKSRIKTLQQINKPIAIEKTPSKLTFETRKFTEFDLAYWEKIGVEKTTLDKFKVQSISSYNWTGKKPIYTKKESVAFIFELENNFKLYIPNQPEIGILKNVLPAFQKGIFGFEQLGTEKRENIIICEGEKDVITASSRGFNAVTFGSGSTHAKQENIKALQRLCNNLFVCYDADDTGIEGMKKITQSNPEITAIYLPKNINIKGYDVTDYFQEHNADDFQKMVDLLITTKN